MWGNLSIYDIKYFSERKCINFVISRKTCESENWNFLTFHRLWQHIRLYLTFYKIQWLFPKVEEYNTEDGPPCFPLLHFNYRKGILSIYWFSSVVSYKSFKKCNVSWLQVISHISIFRKVITVFTYSSYTTIFRICNNKYRSYAVIRRTVFSEKILFSIENYRQSLGAS